MAFNVDQALAQGYSYTDIAIFLAQQQNFDIGSARNEGYTDAEIANHLAITYTGENLIENQVKNYDSNPTVTTQQTEQIHNTFNTRDAYKDIAGSFIFVALLSGLVFYLMMPKKFKASTPFEMGRVWLGWLMAAAVLSASNYYVKDGIDKALGMFLAVVIVMGPLAILFGWLYGKYFKFASPNSHITGSSNSANKLPEKKDNYLDNNSYLLALEEYDSDKRDKALWAKCFALCDGDESKTKAAYVKERANPIIKSTDSNSKQYIDAGQKNGVSESTPIINPEDKASKVTKPNHDFVSMSLADKPSENSIDYKSRSNNFLLQNGMFNVIKHGSIEIMLLKNGRAAVQVGEEIKVFENESRCKNARLHDKYAVGLMATIKVSDLLDDDAIRENAAQKLNYKNMKELREKVDNREPSAMFDMANILLDHDSLSSAKQRALVLLESAAIHGHTEANKLWHHLRGDSIKCPVCSGVNEAYVSKCFRCGLKLSLGNIST